MASIAFQGKIFDCRDSETVLDALLRHNIDLPYSCRQGTCLSCMLRVGEGDVPPAAQESLRETLRLQGYFLACQCRPKGTMKVSLPEDAAIYGRAKVIDVARIAPNICRLRLEPSIPLYYHAGQFVNLRRDDGVVRSYSLASVPRLDHFLELHVKCLPGGVMSNWIFNDIRPGDAVDIQGPNGSCFYVPGKLSQGLLLICNGTGLAPLIGVVRDALDDAHAGPIHLYHGTRFAEGLYLRKELEALTERYDNVTYTPCLSGSRPAVGCRVGRAEVAAFSNFPDMTGWRVFISGYAPMVHAAKKQAYLAGAAIDDIHADPFELRELRRKPRDE